MIFVWWKITGIKVVITPTMVTYFNYIRTYVTCISLIVIQRREITIEMYRYLIHYQLQYLAARLVQLADTIWDSTQVSVIMVNTMILTLSKSPTTIAVDTAQDSTKIKPEVRTM